MLGFIHVVTLQAIFLFFSLKKKNMSERIL